MESCFGLQCMGSIPNATKDSPSVCGVHTFKICVTECPAVGLQKFITGVVSGEKIPFP